jgi:hypothetical protein
MAGWSLGPSSPKLGLLLCLGLVAGAFPSVCAADRSALRQAGSQVAVNPQSIR